ncbi:MAG: DUF4249 domain-containing protein, partial [Cyclobacteriaceae bacterium]|nr:DUF4249 domain-containing protein [Cyclobacteriaceae bacterium]
VKAGFIGLILIALALTSCETTINPELQAAEPVLVVDAWVTNKPGNQVIVLTKTQNYFDSSTPPAVSAAVVKVTDNNGTVFTFNEDVNAPGKYVWTPVANETFGTIGNTYELSIVAEGQTYKATSKMGRAPVVDSITLKKNEPDQINPDFYRAQFFANDFPGKGDAYWIRAYKNKALLNKPADINVAYDAGFSAGGSFDGITFIPPIRGRINPNDTDANDKAVTPYVPGDSVYVEINAITPEAFTYLQQVSIQTNRPGGFSELFARPIANVPTNIVNVDVNGKQAIGFFNVGAVSGKGQKLQVKK